MYVRLRYTALSVVLLGLMASSHANAQSHIGTTSIAQGVIYKCPNNHTVDIFGDEDSDLGLSASVDNKASMPLTGQFQYPNIDDEISMVFGKQADHNGLIVSQNAARRGEHGDHSVDVAYIENGVEVWSYASCHAE